MTLPFFVAACRVGYSSHTFGYSQLNHHRTAFIDPLSASIVSDVDVIRHYEVVRNTELDPILYVLAVRRALKVDWDSYVGVEHHF